MKTFFIFLLLLCSFSITRAQSVDELIDQGVELHDKQDYDGALAKYEAALKMEPGSHMAMFEKSYTLIALKKYDEANELLKKVLKESKDAKVRRLSYVQYGTSMDYLGKGKESVRIYEEGMKEFPDYYLLPFNKGITLSGLSDAAGAMESFQTSVQLNPLHASSHNALAQLNTKKRIQAMMSLFAFLMIEPEGKRAELNLIQLNKQINLGVERKDDKNVTINIDANLLDDKNKPREDDFTSAEFMFSIVTANDKVPDSIGAKTDADRLSFKMQMLINLLDETAKKKDKGFYKTFYVPMFIALKKSEQITTACYIVLASSGKDDIMDWIKANDEKVSAYFDWLKAYKWN